MIRDSDFDVVTGAFGYTGKYITRRLLCAGRTVRTLTGHPNRPNEFGERVEVAPLDFHDSDALVSAMAGAKTLFNTYWVRFNHRGETFDGAVANSRSLIEAARKAGVQRIVHLSIANPSLGSPLPYYWGKAQVEKAIVESGLAYTILRPTVVFGPEDILINNIAWFTRRFPMFAIPGSGRYELQPIFVQDLADLAVRGARIGRNEIIDAVGPERFAFEDLVERIAHAVGASPRLLRVYPGAALQALRLIGLFMGDVILTREELEGLMANLLVSKREPAGRTKFSAWLAENARALGTRYSSEIERHYRS